MDLTGMIQNPVEDQSSEQKLSKEEYAALKKQERLTELFCLSTLQMTLR